MSVDIQFLLEHGEGEKTEFKERLPAKNELARIFVAFANHDGGHLVIGVNDDKEVVGVHFDDQTDRFIADVSSNNCEPPVRVKTEMISYDGMDVLAIAVPKGNELHAASGRYYTRVGSTVRRLTTDEIRRLMIGRGMIEFDAMVAEGAMLDDIDENKVRWFLRKAQAVRNLDIDPDTPLDEALRKLNLVVDGKVVNAAVLMFGDDPQYYHIQSEVRCARFKGKKTVKPFIDMKIIGGTLLDQIDQAEKFVLFHMKRAVWVEPGKVEREERWDYPPDAIREAITNAVCHRDYCSSGNVQIRILDDRIEVWNPGLLPEGLTIEDLKGQHESRPRNKLLAKLFFMIKYIEQWGTGTTDMIDSCVVHGLPAPAFEEIAGSFVVTFRGSGPIDSLLEHAKLNDRQNRIIVYLMEHDRITNRECRVILNTGKKSAYLLLKGLQEAGIIDRHGRGRSVYYSLRSKGND